MAHAVAPGHDPGLTIACLDEDFADWRRGRAHALAWVVELDEPDLRELVRAGRRRLAAYLHPRYERAPHATLAFCGLAPADAPQEDDFTPAHLAAQLAALRASADGPITLRAIGWGTFPMVPHLVLECDWLHAARDALADAGAGAGHSMDYVPHVTLGHYRGRWPLAEPVGRLTGLPAPGTWRAGAVSLVRYEAADIAGPLEVVGRIDLTTRRWHPA